MVDAAIVQWTLGEVAKVVQRFLERSVQVKENRSAAVRLSLLLSGITVSLAEKYKDGADVIGPVRMFRNNTVPYIIGLIDECSGLRILQRNNAKLLYDRLREGERELRECIDGLEVVLPKPCKDGLTKFTAEQEGRFSSQEPRKFAEAVGSSFSRILGRVTRAGDRVFKSPADRREVIDLVFMCDVTGGMANSGCLDKVKDRIAEVARSTRTILEERAGLLRVGMVAYRDLWGGEEPMLEIEDLTPHVGRVISHVRRLVPTGGLDLAENVLGGLEAVVEKLSWDDYNKKVLVHFADAPCHGSEYHNLQPKDDLLYDMSKYQEKCGRKSLQKAIERLAEDKVEYIFVKMNNSTDKMISKFREMAKKEDFLTEVLMTDSTLTAKIVEAMDIERTNLVPFCDATNAWPADATSIGYPVPDAAADAPNPVQVPTVRANESITSPVDTTMPPPTFNRATPWSSGTTPPSTSVAALHQPIYQQDATPWSSGTATPSPPPAALHRPVRQQGATPWSSGTATPSTPPVALNRPVRRQAPHRQPPPPLPARDR